MGPAGHIAEKDVYRCDAGGRALSHLLGESLNIYLLPYACLIEIGSAASTYATVVLALTHASVALRHPGTNVFLYLPQHMCPCMEIQSPLPQSHVFLTSLPPTRRIMLNTDKGYFI